MSPAYPDIELGAIATLWDCLHKTPSYSDDGYPMVRVTDIRRGYLDLSGTLKVDDNTYQEFIRRYKPKVGDILLTRVGSYGNSCYVDRDHDLCLGQNTVCIAPDHRKTVPYFLYCCLNATSVKDQIDAFVGGASQPTISLRNILRLRIPFPDITAQQKIAAIILAYDDLIENNLRRIKILEEMAQNLYREWFVKFRFPGHKNFKMVDSPKGKIPEGWKVATLGSLCRLVKNPFREALHSDLPLLDLARIPQKTLLPSEVGNARELKTSRIIFSSDDVLFGSIRPYLHKVVLAPFSGVTNVSVLVIRGLDDFINPFLTVLLSNEDSVRWANQYSTGTKMPVINWEIFQQMNVVVPNRTLLENYYNVTSSMMQFLKNTYYRNTALRQTRDLLLPKLISSELDISELDIAIPEATA